MKILAIQFQFLTLEFDKKTNKITLIERNHKIAWAIKNDIPWVPVKVIVYDENNKVSSIPPYKKNIHTLNFIILI